MLCVAIMGNDVGIEGGKGQNKTICSVYSFNGYIIKDENIYGTKP